MAQPFDDAGAATGPLGTFPVRAVFALTEACFLGLLVGACFGGSLVTTIANPSRMLVLTSTTSHLIYHICKRGEYVEIGLPHHSHGGEKYWVSRTGKTKVLINVD